ncbi:SKP1/BTB/POZ domain superfamily [Sesbania bispinosa]|nr:SKP1/BTB/POZ domain superfamily [Sesbania bispinosa]
MNAFLDSISGDARAARHSVVKDSIADVLRALLSILQCKNGPLVKHGIKCGIEVKVAIPCATALNLLISNLSATSERAIMEALKETDISIRIVGNIKDFAIGAKKIEYFEEMASLLSTILLRWPSSRFPVFNDVEFMNGLANMHTRMDSSIQPVLLKLYTSLALCDSVAKKLIEDGKVFLQMVVQAMGKSNPYDVRIEGFRLAQCLLRSQENCLKVVDLCGEALVDAIDCGMRETGLSSNKMGTTMYHGCIIESKGIKAVVLLVQRCLSNDIHVERPDVASHLHSTFHERSCCWIGKEDWEGSDVLLFYGLWSLAEFLHQCGLLQDNPRQFTREVTNIKAQLVSKLNETFSSTSFSPGVKWYVSYILSYFGFYGFPNEFAKRIGESLNKEEYKDLRLIVANEDSVSVHGVILAVRCPSLLPPEVLSSSKSSKEVTDKFAGETMREVRLSSRVDYEALLLLLEYVYLGCLHAGEEALKKLKILAKRCNLQPLLRMLYRQCPKWGTLFPSLNLTSSLDSAGSCFSYGLLLDQILLDILRLHVIGVILCFLFHPCLFP